MTIQPHWPGPPEVNGRVGGKYQLLRRLASGGMGDVWIARNEATGAHVAIKRCRWESASDDARMRFRHEARLGAMLSHRSIVRIFDLIEEPDGTPLLVMELLRGETLDRVITRHGPLPCKEAVAIALPILSALAHAHASGIVHRDVTPANIFLTLEPDGRVVPKLVDFGIAKVPDGEAMTLDGQVLGTPRYMAPERIRGSTTLDGRSDCFSMGVILCEMTTGECPFAASSPAASLAAVLESVVEPDPRIDPRVWIEIERALAKRPYERHLSASAMAEALRVAVGETEATLAELLRAPLIPVFDEPAASAPQVPGRQRLPHPRPRARWIIGTIAAALTAALVLVVVFERAVARTPAAERTLTMMPAPPLAPEPARVIASAPAAAPAPAATAAREAAPHKASRRPTSWAKPIATTPGF
ncbi:MAG: serine/threonine-protein kinase [Polyangiaceae bacterium]